MKICGIYKITSPLGRIYIGQSVNINGRKTNYKNLNCKEQSRLYNSIKKHGWDNHSFEIIHQCLRSELNELEKYYVDLFQTFNTAHGLNLQDGGGVTGTQSKESNIKRSKALLGRKRPAAVVAKLKQSGIDSYKNGRICYWKGKKRSQETIKKIFESRKGKYIAWNKGISWSEEAKDKMSKSHIGIPIWNKGLKGLPKRSESTKAKMRLAQKARWRLRKQLV